MILLPAAGETIIHWKWDLKTQVCGMKNATVSFGIEHFTINIKTTTTTSVLMELSEKPGLQCLL